MKNDKNILIAVAPNGPRRKKIDHPNIPLNSSEIGQTAKECLAAGASMMHLHVRNSEDDSHSLSVDLYRKAIAEIKKVTDDNIFVQVTSEAVGIYTAEEQFEMIHNLKPNAVSLCVREINSLDESVIHQHFIKMKQANTYPQIIVFSQADLDQYHDWLAREVLPGNKYPLLVVIGRPNTTNSFENSFLTKANIDKLKASSWMICAFGENEYYAAKLAINLGGNVRLGFENNTVLADGTEAKSNAALITQIHEYLKLKNIQAVNLNQTKAMMTPDW